MTELTREQEKVIDALAARHGAAKVLPLERGAVIARGWHEHEGSDLRQPGRWWYVSPDPCAVMLRWARDDEVDAAVEANEARELLTEAGLTP